MASAIDSIRIATMLGYLLVGGAVLFIAYLVMAIRKHERDRTYMRANVSRYGCPKCAVLFEKKSTYLKQDERREAFRGYVRQREAELREEARAQGKRPPVLKADQWLPDCVCLSCGAEFTMSRRGDSILFTDWNKNR